MSELMEVFQGVGESVTTFITEKPITSTAIGVGVVGVGIVGGLALSKTKKRKKKKTSRGIKRDRKFISKQKHEIRRRRKKKPAKIYKKKGTYWSRKPLRKSKKRVGKTYYTKKGQPYKIMASGKARFIKKGGKR